MEIDITEFFTRGFMKRYSASIHEAGQNAGLQTWNAACADSKAFFMLDDDEKREAFKEHVSGFGAWTREEIDAWNNNELNALFMQLVAGDVRESPLNESDWESYESNSDGQYASNIFRTADGKIYYDLG